MFASKVFSELTFWPPNNMIDFPSGAIQNERLFYIVIDWEKDISFTIDSREAKCNCWLMNFNYNE